MSLRILKIKNTTKEWNKDTTTGLYKRVNPGTDTLMNGGHLPEGLTDIMLEESPITIVKAKTQNNRIYSIGDQFKHTVTAREPKTIESFIVRQNVIFAKTGQSTYNLDTIYPYVAPAPVIEVEQPAVNNGVDSLIALESLISRSNPRAVKLHEFRFREESLTEFLTKFFRSYNNNFRTVYKDDGSTQTPAGKRRSLGDVYMICKEYYPECTLRDVIKLLYVTLPETMSDLGTLKCETILKRVWWIFGTSRADHKTSNDEYGKPWRWYIAELAKPVVNTQPVVETAGRADIDRIKAQFKKGTKFKLFTGSKDTCKVDSENFYDGLKFIILIQSDGSRKIVYDKVNNKTAKIVQ